MNLSNVAIFFRPGNETWQHDDEINRQNLPTKHSVIAEVLANVIIEVYFFGMSTSQRSNNKR